MSIHKLSIITPVCNNLDATRSFLENVVKYTKSNYQLIIINNNSKDGTRDYLKTKSDLTNIFVIKQSPQQNNDPKKIYYRAFDENLKQFNNNLIGY